LGDSGDGWSGGRMRSLLDAADKTGAGQIDAVSNVYLLSVRGRFNTFDEKWPIAADVPY
jgi:hypothetical protein